MATRQPTTGMAHLTVVPENFEETAETEDETPDADGAVVARADGAE